MSGPSLSARLFEPFFDDADRELADHLTHAVPPAFAESGHQDPSAAVRTMAALGLFRHLLPSGQRTVRVRSLVTIREALGFSCPLADAIFAVQGLGSYPIAARGSEKLSAEYLPGVLDGSRVGAFALTEPEAGSDVASLRTRATRDGADWLLDGEKTLISNVGIATHYVVFARACGFGDEEKLGAKTITAFLVDRGAPGLTETALPMSSPHPLGRLSFTRCRVSDAARIGEIGRGLALALETLDTFRISVGAAANGMAARALSESIRHVTERRQFGAALSEQPIIRAYLAEMATDLDAAQLLVARAAHAHDESGGKRVTRQAAMAKLFATETAQTTIDRAVQLHGGSGVLSGTVVEALYRDIRPLRIYEGTSEIQKLIIAKTLLPSPAS